ncbi:MAG: GNAT family N-acetyltransferase [Chitinophagaceae bacterium]|nr:GNAT family N-acetyltransferase [Chitinophagaceae bacterium]
MLVLNFTSFPQLTTEHLLLRRLSEADAHDLLMLRSNEQVNQFLDRPACIDLEAAKNFIAKIEKGIINKQSLYWVITLKGNDKLVGTICLWNFDADKMQAEVGFELFPGFQGKGIMREALSGVLAFGFKELHLKTITALTNPGNLPSIKLLEKADFLADSNNTMVTKEDAEGLLVFYTNYNI